MVPAHACVASARRSPAKTSICAVLPDPCDRTSAFPLARANWVPSGNHPRVQYSLRPRRAPVQLAARWSVERRYQRGVLTSERRPMQSQAVGMRGCAWPTPLLMQPARSVVASMRHNCGRCGDLFRNCEEILCRQQLRRFRFTNLRFSPQLVLMIAVVSHDSRANRRAENRRERNNK
jgi:hypothetical protein